MITCDSDLNRSPIMTSTAISAAAVPLMTVEQFLDWPGDGHVGKQELVDGVVRAMAPSATLGTIQANLARLIGNHLVGAGSPCRVVTEAPIVPRFKPHLNARAPDLAVNCAPPSRSRTLQSPILIIEVLSPSNVDETWETIRAVATLPTVTEVLVVSSTEVMVEVFTKDAVAGWPAEGVAFASLADAVPLASIELTMQLADVYGGTILAA
jgi:Uma2 family endonuclease